MKSIVFSLRSTEAYQTNTSYMVEGMILPNGIDISLLDTGTPSLVGNYAMSKAGMWMLPRDLLNATVLGKTGSSA